MSVLTDKLAPCEHDLSPLVSFSGREYTSAASSLTFIPRRLTSDLSTELSLQAACGRHTSLQAWDGQPTPDHTSVTAGRPHTYSVPNRESVLQGSCMLASKG